MAGGTKARAWNHGHAEFVEQPVAHLLVIVLLIERFDDPRKVRQAIEATLKGIRLTAHICRRTQTE